MAGIKKLLFVDTNVWLDFYRPRESGAAMELLQHLDSIRERIIVTHVLEMEYKKNRQIAIAEGLKGLKAPELNTYGIFSQAKASKTIQNDLQSIGKQAAKLRKRLERALEEPGKHDPVYQTCQRIFRREDDLVLRVDSPAKTKRVIRERALRRYYLGCPPRKAGELSIGDAINWEWMVMCAEENDAELVILTRDLDYGPKVGQKIYLNDYLNQEFKDRVSRKRKVLLYSSAAQALQYFKVKVSKETEQSESAFIEHTPPPAVEQLMPPMGERRVVDLLEFLRRSLERASTPAPGQNVDMWISSRGEPSKPPDGDGTPPGSPKA